MPAPTVVDATEATVPNAIAATVAAPTQAQARSALRMMWMRIALAAIIIFLMALYWLTRPG